MRLLKGHPFIVPVTTFLVLFFMTLAAYVASGGQTLGPSDSHVVRLHVNGEQQIVPTRAKTVGEFLERRGISVQEKDIIEPPLDSRITDDNFEINVYKARAVLVVDNGVKTFLVTAQPTLEGVVEEAGAKVNPEDKIETAPPEQADPTQAIEEGLVVERVIIKRAVPIKLNLYGSVFEIRTHADTVQELLDERSIEHTETSVFPSLETELKKDDLVVVTEPGKEIDLKEETIPFEEKLTNDNNLPLGQRQIQREGRKGRRVLIYEIRPDGSKQVLQEIVLVSPINSLVKVGRKAVAAVGGSNAELLRQLRMCETGGNYQTNTGNGYYGAYQFSIPTWNSMGTGYPRADLAPASVQDDATLRLAKRSGFHSQFPGCSAKLGLPAYPH